MAFGSTARALLPASMAGLPARRAMVWVGPPLAASVPRSGSATPTRLPLLPLVSPPAAAGADQVVRAGRGHRAAAVE